jgi:hypothetical protein
MKTFFSSTYSYTVVAIALNETCYQNINSNTTVGHDKSQYIAMYIIQTNMYYSNFHVTNAIQDRERENQIVYSI